ncbi:MAG: hypothetical protein VX874_20940 [Pseudomonadota bacterium]|nr:hypothetical protein [Pseudomonadota bacterium]
MTNTIAVSAIALSLGLSAVGFFVGIPATAQATTEDQPEQVELALGVAQQDYRIIANPAARGLPPLDAHEMYVEFDEHVYRMARANASILTPKGAVVSQ